MPCSRTSRSSSQSSWGGTVMTSAVPGNFASPFLISCKSATKWVHLNTPYNGLSWYRGRTGSAAAFSFASRDTASGSSGSGAWHQPAP
eukprot:13950265-Alexandrium_andersonii.AAC.1